METKHTPAPWTIQEDTADNWSILTEGKTIALSSLEDIENGFMTVEETQANAQLIAAAPELAEMLIKIKKVINNSEHWWIDCPDKGGFDLREIEQTLIKAGINI